MPDRTDKLNLLKSLSKKGQVASLQPLTIAIIVIAVTVVVAFNIFAGLKPALGPNETPLNTTSFAFNATSTVETAVQDNLVNNLGLVILIAVFAVILALVGFFAVAARRR